MSLDDIDRKTKSLQEQRKRISHWKASQLIDLDMQIKNLERQMRKVRSNMKLV